MNNVLLPLISTLTAAGLRNCAASSRQFNHGNHCHQSIWQCFAPSLKRHSLVCREVLQTRSQIRCVSTRIKSTVKQRQRESIRTPRILKPRTALPRRKDTSEAWRKYDPEGGLPLPGGEISSQQATRIFGKDVHVDTANYILAVLHWRRMAGALIDVGIDFPKDSKVTPEQALTGLEYLRKTYPRVDERALGVQWFEEESFRIGSKYEEQAIKLRLYKRVDQDEVGDYQDEAFDHETAYRRERTGTSAVEGLLGALEDRKVAKADKRAIDNANKERSTVQKARGPLELTGGVQRTVDVRRYGSGQIIVREPLKVSAVDKAKREELLKHYTKKAQVTDNETVPEMSMARRLVPSFLFATLFIALCVFYSNTYTPPTIESRIFSSIPPSVATVGGVTILLCTAFVLGRVPPLWRFANKYFCIVPAYPFSVSLLGAIFRHDNIAHLIPNVAVLWLFGLGLHEDVGRGTFLAIFLGTGVLGSFSALAHNVLIKEFLCYIYGASAGVLGVLGAACTLHPTTSITVFGYQVPIAAWALLLIVGAIDLYGAVRLRSRGIDHVGHLGGLLSGVLAAIYLKSKQQTAEIESECPAMMREKVGVEA